MAQREEEMQKEKLKKLRTLNLTPAIERRAKRDLPVYETVKTWNNKTEKRVKSLHRYAYYLRCQHLAGILKVAVFTPYMIQQGEKSPAFEIFINIAGEEFITRYFLSGAERWSNAKIDNLQYVEGWPDLHGNENDIWSGTYAYRCDAKSWINPEGSKNIRRLLGTSRTGYEGILEWQERIREKKRDENDAKVFKPWDDDLKLFPKIPARFVNWAFRNNTEHYIFYNAGEKKGYCSRCQKEVPIKGQRHRKTGTCPKCRGRIVYLANGKKSKYLITPVAVSQIIQPIKDGYAVQVIETQRLYWNNAPLAYDAPELRWDVKYKIIVQGESVRGYSEGYYKQRIFRWIPDAWICRKYNLGRIYKGNANEIQKMFPHSALPILIQKEIDIPIIRYIDKEKEYPVFESLVKLGLYEIVADAMRGYISESFAHREAARALELDGCRLKKLLSLGGSVVAWEWLKLEKRMNTVFDPEMIRYFAKQGIMEYQMDFICDKMSYQKIYHYLKKQEDLTGEAPAQLLITWRDYLNMADKNRLNTEMEQNYKPANIKQAHKDMIALARKEEIKKQAAPICRKYKKIERNIKELVKYEYSADGYAIVAPKGVEDIILEGLVLKHCIHTCDFYFERINAKESYILFLRRTGSINTPWYTLEVEPGGNIRQKRTTGDNQNDDLKAAFPFLKKWQREIRKRMSKEDKKLADISDRKRKENYKTIRINKKLVWHGKHQGELLADVLEADFMAAL